MLGADIQTGTEKCCEQCKRIWTIIFPCSATRCELHFSCPLTTMKPLS